MGDPGRKRRRSRSLSLGGGERGDRYDNDGVVVIVTESDDFDNVDDEDNTGDGNLGTHASSSVEEVQKRVVGPHVTGPNEGGGGYLR